MKKLIRRLPLFLLLLPILAFGQGPDLINTVADTASLATIRGGDGQVMYLRQYSSTDTSGGGWFIVRTSSESTGTNYFSHPDPAKQWVRRDTDALEQGFVSDTTALKLLSLGEGKTAYLKQLSSTNTSGGGWFVAADSVYDEQYGGVSFPHPTAGLQWIRIEYEQGLVSNVLWYGADPDSNSESTTAFINAQQMALVNGSKLFVPGGKYKISGGFDAGKFYVYGGIEMQGVMFGRGLNRQQSYLFPANDGDSILVISHSTGAGISGVGVTISHIQIEGITLSGDSAEVGFDCSGGQEILVEDMVIRNLTRADTAWGIVIRDRLTMQFNRVMVERADINLYINSTNGIYFNDCRFMRTKLIGTWLVETVVTNFFNCDWETNSQAKAPHSSNIHAVLIKLQHAVATSITGGYMEAGASDSLEIAIDYDTYYDTPGLLEEGWTSELNVYGARFLTSSLDYPLNIDSHQFAAFNMFGGNFIYSTNTNEIGAVKDTVTNSVNFWNSNIGSSTEAGARMRTIIDYDSANFNVIPSGIAKFKMPFVFMGEVMFDGKGGFYGGVRANGAGNKRDNNRNMMSAPFSAVSGAHADSTMGTDNKINVTAATDTIDIIVTRNNDASWTNVKYECEFYLSHPGGDFAQAYNLKYWQHHDATYGVDSNYTEIRIDTLYNYPTAGEGTDSIWVENRTSDGFTIVVTMNSSWAASTFYFSGETIYGRNVSNVSAAIREQ